MHFILHMHAAVLQPHAYLHICICSTRLDLHAYVHMHLVPTTRLDLLQHA